MKYLFINSVYGKWSTGKLLEAKCHELQRQGHICYVAYGREAVDDGSVQLFQIGSKCDYLTHAALSRVFDMQGFCSKGATRRFLETIEDYHFDCVWIHNLHGYYINLELLFAWLKRHPEIKVYWTLHDCWAFTGHCAHFLAVGCSKWRTGCGHCPQRRTYPKSLWLDRSKTNYRRKKEAFSGIKDMMLITPSNWLANLTRDSFLRDYPVQVIHNKIDSAIFRPTPSDFREKYGLSDKYIVLGVAAGWDEAKGYPDMLTLRKALSDNYVLVLVGLTHRQVLKLPDGVLGIERTNDQIELAKIYTAADVFVNPTHQDNYPTVNLEARACGIPVITYNVGGSPESAGWEHIVEEGDIEGLAERVRRLTAAKDVRVTV